MLPMLTNYLKKYKNITLKNSQVDHSGLSLFDPLKDRIKDTGYKSSADIVSKESPKEVVDHIISQCDGQGLKELKPSELLDVVTFKNETTVGEVVECLKKYGLAIFPEIYDSERLKRVQRQYEYLMSSGEKYSSGVDARANTSSHSDALRILRSQLPIRQFSEVHELFASPTIKNITDEIFFGQEYEFNENIYSQWTKHTEVPASGRLHWDKQLTLKSWLYVTDGFDEHGPMRAGVGSNRWLRYVREDAMFNGLAYSELDNSVEESEVPIVSTGGPAGTFFFFITDTAHGASSVDEGKVRNIIRAQSRPKRIAQWAAWANKR